MKWWYPVGSDGCVTELDCASDVNLSTYVTGVAILVGVCTPVTKLADECMSVTNL